MSEFLDAILEGRSGETDHPKFTWGGTVSAGVTLSARTSQYPLLKEILQSHVDAGHLTHIKTLGKPPSTYYQNKSDWEYRRFFEGDGFTLRTCLDDRRLHSDIRLTITNPEYVELFRARLDEERRIIADSAGNAARGAKQNRTYTDRHRPQGKSYGPRE